MAAALGPFFLGMRCPFSKSGTSILAGDRFPHLDITTIAPQEKRKCPCFAPSRADCRGQHRSGAPGRLVGLEGLDARGVEPGNLFRSGEGNRLSARMNRKKGCASTRFVREVNDVRSDSVADATREAGPKAPAAAAVQCDPAQRRRPHGRLRCPHDAERSSAIPSRRASRSPAKSTIRAGVSSTPAPGNWPN